VYVQVTDRDRAVTRFDRRAATYDRSVLQPVFYLPVQQATLHLAARRLPRPRRILDVGCGTGTLLRQAAKRFPDAHLIGVDLAGAMLAAADAATPAELPIWFVHGRAERLPLADAVFDLVLSTVSFRHWSDQSAALGQIRRVLTPGGVLVLAEVFAAPPRRTIVPIMRRHRDRVELPAEVKAMLADHDLAVTGCQHLRGYGPISQVVVVVARTSSRAARERSAERGGRIRIG
jgi:ubiquinone/menaquinone biosynthesis C-methylase UbiE